MKTSEIYQKYNIPPNLQEHMYRVAAVGMVLVDMLAEQVELDKKIVVTTLLLHDMGNLIKFDLENSPLFVPEDIEYWKKVQADFIARYGREEHEATIAILKELNVPEKVIDIFSNIGSFKVHLTVDSSDWYRKICSYADFRVAPHGIVSIDERWDDVLKRYEGRDHVLADIQQCEEKRKMCLVLERQIQENVSVPLFTINDAEIESIIKELPGFNIG